MRKHDDHIAMLLTGTKRTAMSPSLGLWPKHDNTGDSCIRNLRETSKASYTDANGRNMRTILWKSGLMNETQQAHHPWMCSRDAPHLGGCLAINEATDVQLKSRRKA